MAAAPIGNPTAATMLSASSSTNDGFRQAMLKSGLDQIPQLTEENYSIWKDKMASLLKLRGVLTKLESTTLALDEDLNAELTFLLISKLDSVTHSNIVTADNRDSAKELWKAIKDRFASSQASNRARIFNEFLYIKFREDAVEAFITDIKISIKKLVDVGIELPQDILAYLILFKFPDNLQILKRQIMHSDKDLSVEFVCNHLNQFNNENKAEINETVSTTQATLYSNKGKSKFQNNDAGSSGEKGQKRCTKGYHNPKQDKNHNEESCWHLHPEVAPAWWREAQEKWKSTQKTNYFMSLVTLWIENGNNKSKIILDSGSSSHVFNDSRFFEQLSLGDLDVIRTGKKDANLAIKGQGRVRLEWGNGTLILENCLYVPDIVVNLISPGLLDAKGCLVKAKSGKFSVIKDDIELFTGKISNNMYSVRNPTKIGANSLYSYYANDSTESLKDTHEKYGHASLQRINSLIGHQISKAERDAFECKACVLSKITKQSFNLESKPTSKVFERLHLDLIGPITPQAKIGSRFILTVVDNFSGYLAGFPLIKKDDTTEILINLLESENKRLGYYPNMICSDGGGEFTGNSKSPWELIHGYALPPNYLKPLGSSAVVLDMNRQKGKKFEVKGQEGVLIGYNVMLRSFRILLKSGAVINSKHVRFLKSPTFIENSDSDFIPEMATEMERETRPLPELRQETEPEDDERDDGETHDDIMIDDVTPDSNSDEEIVDQLVPQPEQPPTRILRDRSQLKPPISRIFFHVDDLVLVGPGNQFKEKFEIRFKNSSCHEPNTILGMKFERIGHKILLSQPKHIEHGLEELGLQNCKPSQTPLTPNLKLTEATDEEHALFKKENINYRSAIGLMNYVAGYTRPDISFAVSSLARFSIKPGIQHWHEVRKVWQYLRTTKELKLTLQIQQPSQLLEIYSDASWADDPQHRTSQSGYLCYLFGSPVSWNSCRQHNVTYSSTEAELNPLVDAFHEGTWLKALLSDIWDIQVDAASHYIDDPELNEKLLMTDEEFFQKYSNSHYIDNKGLDDKLKKFGSNPKTRHIDLKTKGIRQEVKAKSINIILIRTFDMLADALTKPAQKSSINNLIKTVDPSFPFLKIKSLQSRGVLPGEIRQSTLLYWFLH
ncbi:hypothetical protein VP01_2688g1 [Puccinia sorghi]|uniref:Integrase catalytic domain-containing protein n=1 Tax=Puccinia sorghi TaxID=27349 RepID=A0A0L6V5M0_9BASI|nr:hypothetical protein VP01_2688g1 [Puccinia sorghi]